MDGSISIWLPPPSDAARSAPATTPKEYFNLDNSYGSFDEHRAMLEALLGKGVEPIADIVLNHRDGSGGWADFSNPAGGPGRSRATTRPSTIRRRAWQIPRRSTRAEEEAPTPYSSAGGTTYAYDVFRDLDHTNGGVRRDLFRYLLQLKSLGYRGWRYDMVHGFHARWVAALQPPHGADLLGRRVRLGQAGRAARLGLAHGDDTPGICETSSTVFDFTTQFTLKDNKDRYLVWYGFGHGLGHDG